jgi:phytanoyl-CoA hydroxylase
LAAISSMRHFREQGYLVLADVFSRDEVNAWIRVIPSVIDENRQLFGLPSDEELPDAAPMLGRILCLHHVHKLSELFFALAKEPRITRVLKSLVGPNVKCVQSQLFIKPPGYPGNPWHQDEGPIPTRDRSLVAAWIAIDDSTVSNGCLQVVPGSHMNGYLYPRREHHYDQEYDFAEESFGFDEKRVKAVEVTAGSMVFFHGYLLHGSARNCSSGYRRAIVYHYMNSYSPLPWRGGQGDYRDIVPVLGRDPYAWKGYDEISVPHLRRWPKSEGKLASAELGYEIREKISIAVSLWYENEGRALSLLRDAIRQIDDSPDSDLGGFRSKNRSDQ